MKALTKLEVAEKADEVLSHINLTTRLSMVSSLLDIIASRAFEGETVNLFKVGKFYTSLKMERPGRNPKTGESHVISSRCRLNFKLSRTAGEKINE